MGAPGLDSETGEVRIVLLVLLALFAGRFCVRPRLYALTAGSDHSSPDCYFPVPSVNVTIRSTPDTANFSTFPLGQCTSIASTAVACPSPKCGLWSFEDM